MRKLERQIGLVSAIAISVSTMLGSGVFVLSGMATKYAGEYLWVAYLVAGLCVIPAVLSKSELSVAMPESGGTYVYIDRTFGPFIGTITGIGLWLALLLKSAFALIGFVAYLSIFTPLPIKEVAFLSLIVITILNIRGVMRVSQIQIITVVIAIIGLLILCVYRYYSDSFGYQLNETPNPHLYGDRFVYAIAFVFVSYAGVTKISAIAEEIKDPDRILPLSMISSLIIAMGLYCLVTFTLVKTIPIEILIHEQSPTPIHTLADTLGGHWFGYIFAGIGSITLISMSNAGLLASSRFPFAMSRDRLLPELLSKIHHKHLIPIYSIICSSLILGAVILFLPIEDIAKSASSFIIMLYMLENFTVIVLRETGVKWYNPKFRAKPYPWIQLFGIVSGMFLLILLGEVAFLSGLAVTVPGVLLYFFYGKKRTERKGVVKQRSNRGDLLTQTNDKTIDPTNDTDDITNIDKITNNASVIVALFGTERSPELLAKLGVALANKEHLSIILIEEIPEQTVLEAVKDNRQIKSIERRVQSFAATTSASINFGVTYSRDIVKTIHRLDNVSQCKWLVMEDVKRTQDSFTFFNSLGWLKNNLHSNTAILHDAGIHYVKKILVHTESNLHDPLIVYTAKHLARIYNASLTFTQFVHQDEPLSTAQAATEHLEKHHQSTQTPSNICIVRGKNRTQALADLSIDYDLLLTADTPPQGFLNYLTNINKPSLSQIAPCSVLYLQTPSIKTKDTLMIIKNKSIQVSSDIQVSTIIDQSLLFPKMTVNSKEKLFTQFAHAVPQKHSQTTPQHIEEALWNRENTHNTAIDNNIALPHASLDSLIEPICGICVLTAPIQYDKTNNQDSDIVVFMLYSPNERKKQLTVLSFLATLFHDTPLADRLRAADTPEDMLKALKQSEQELNLKKLNHDKATV